jgi:PPP family 3-phenylpropionic acid transporter
VLWLALGALALTFAASLALPDLRTPPSARGGGRMRLFLRREFALFILATSLLQASHAVYYGFATLHWRAAGHSETLIGALWAEGVIAEVALFAVSGGAAAVARLAPVPLLLIAAAGGVLRWSVLGLTDAVWALAAAQALHALTFGASHLAAMRFILREVPPEMTSTAQSLYYSLAGGVASALFMLGAGWLYAGFGAHAYFGMAAASIVGGAVALTVGRFNTSSRSDGR